MNSLQSNLFANPYPGRTLIVGMTPSGEHYVQVYWIMGRSANSRNRVFQLDNESVQSIAFDPALMEDPSLIIYYPIRHWDNIHIVSNGDQTDTIYEGLQQRKTFEQSLMLRQFEPDAPHYTPRISAEAFRVNYINRRMRLPSFKPVAAQGIEIGLKNCQRELQFRARYSSIIVSI